MSKRKVYVVLYYSYGYDCKEYESLIGMSDDVKVAEIIARGNKHDWEEPIIVFSSLRHRQLSSSGTTHVYIAQREVKDD